MSMPFDVAEAALRLAGASGLPFHVQMAGGEPTLEPGTIEAIAKTVRRSGWPATMAIQTNGTLLSEKLIAICRQYGVDINVSIDGPPSIQEKLRGNAKAAFCGLDLLSRLKMTTRVTAVLSSGNVGCLGELVLCLAAFPNIRGIALDPLVKKGKAAEDGCSEPEPAAITANVRDMLGALDMVNRMRAIPIRLREYDAVRRALRNDYVKGVYCHACLGESLAVHPDGTVYPCGQTVGDRTKTAGNLDNIDWALLRDMYAGVELRDNCGECGLNGRCPGDCPSRLQYNAGASTDAMCAVYRTIADRVSGMEIS
jgi:uncharacterized protein